MRLPFRLSFLLPQDAQLAVGIDRCLPFDNGCDAAVHGAGLAIIGGPSREAVFVAAAAFIAALCEGLGPLSIAATMKTERQPGIPSGRDSWSIVVGAEVAFCATSIAPEIPPLPARPPPHALEEVGR